MTSNIYWILEADIGVGNLGALKRLTSEFCEATREEEGTIAYEWSLSADESVLHIYERFADSGAALAHLERVGPRLPELFGLVSLTEIECYGAATGAFKEAVKELPVVYFESFNGFHR